MNDIIKEKQISNVPPHLKRMYEMGCAAGENIVADNQPTECRIIGGYGNDPKGKENHKDLDVMVVVEETTGLENIKEPVQDVKGHNIGGKGEDKFVKKPLDVFVCGEDEEDSCYIPVTTGRGMQKQSFSKTEGDFREKGFNIEETRDKGGQ